MTRLSLEERKTLAREAEQHGMYSSSLEHDSCGMGFVASIKGVKSHAIVKDAITVLDHKYVKYGLPRQLQPGDVVLLAAYQGVLVAVEPKAPSVEVAYLLVNMERCEFQPYQFES